MAQVTGALLQIVSPPVRGAWIETLTGSQARIQHWSPPVRGAWIETAKKAVLDYCLASPPVRGAWIETSFAPYATGRHMVASREGGVD